jgi:hypothetical protein
MEVLKLQELLPRLNGFFPVTGEDGGNYTQLWLNGGEKMELYKKTKTVLTELAKFFAKDVTLIKKQAAGVLGYSKDLPLLLTPQLVLIPVKVREASFKDEGTLGYAIFQNIETVQPVKEGIYKASLAFYDGSSLFTLNTVHKLRQKLNEAVDLIKAENRRVNLGVRFESLLACEESFLERYRL